MPSPVDAGHSGNQQAHVGHHQPQVGADLEDKMIIRTEGCPLFAHEPLKDIVLLFIMKRGDFVPDNKLQGREPLGIAMKVVVKNGCLLTMNGICEACLQPHDFDCHYSITPVRIVQITCKALSLSLSLLSPLSSLLFSHFSPLSPYTTHARQPCSHPTRHHPLKEGNTWS